MGNERQPADWTREIAERARLDQWRSLADALKDPEVLARVRESSPVEEQGDDPTGSALTRRGFLQLLSASMAVAGLAACSHGPPQSIVPYARAQRNVIPGVPRWYATARVHDGYATGLLAESHEGRPTKIEGNPEHPDSLGATSAFDQAWVLSLYDPSRARILHQRGEPRTFEDVIRAFGSGDGRGLHIVLAPTSSPTVAAQLDALRRAKPSVSIHFHAPCTRSHVWTATNAAFGRVLEPAYDLRAARVIVALDDDLLSRGPGHLRAARQFADGRRAPASPHGMNRLYVAEPGWTSTGMAADHRLRVRRTSIRAVAAAILSGLMDSGTGRDVVPADLRDAFSRAGAASPDRAWLEWVLDDLRNHAGASLVTAGDEQPPDVHAMVYAINALLGNVGPAVAYHASPLIEAGTQSHSLVPLVEALRAGSVEHLLLLNVNPVYDAPADLDFANALRGARNTLCLSLYEHETASRCEWFVPAAHGLESWGDARASDGTVTLVQPVLRPLYDGRTVPEILAALSGTLPPDPFRILRDEWVARFPNDDNGSTAWDAFVGRGLLPDSALPVETTAIQWETFRTLVSQALATPTSNALELTFHRDARVDDGRFANNAWLLELPDPVTRLTWDNAALLSPATAARLGASDGSILEIHTHLGSLHIPALLIAGHADESIALPLGYGRSGGEVLARGLGTDVYPLRTLEAPSAAFASRVLATSSRADLALAQVHNATEGRPIVPEHTLEAFLHDPAFAAPQRRRHPSLYALRPSAQQQWAMSIDLNACTGCAACVVACQAENNIPIVGKDGVMKGRAMHWLRIDRYITEHTASPRAMLLPMMCQHCEKAPCEYVCPVGATVHSSDGLNEMVYNRCVGTRFCSNNCPYKVRRFNYLDYHAGETDAESMVHNPEVTVRERGVMEKCTYCVQRIRRAEVTARRELRAIADGEVRTACEQACASRAIVFGSLGDPGSAVARAHADVRSYAVLDELGTEPRTRYLARITNPHPGARTP